MGEIPGVGPEQRATETAGAASEGSYLCPFPEAFVLDPPSMHLRGWSLTLLCTLSSTLPACCHLPLACRQMGLYPPTPFSASRCPPL